MNILQCIQGHVETPCYCSSNYNEEILLHCWEQFRWFKQYEDALNFLRQKNTGVCRRTGKTFGELIAYFIVGGDESGFIANSNGTVRIVGDRSKSKHEKNCADSRSFITLDRTGFVAGDNGPTAFIMAGKNRRTGY